MIDAILHSNRTDGSEFTLQDNVVLAIVHDGSARFLDMNGEFFALPAPGGLLVHALVESGQSAVNNLAVQLSIGPEEIALLAGDLERNGLIHRAGASSRTEPRKRIREAPLTMLVRMLHPFRWSIAGVWALLAAAYLSFHALGYARTVAIWQREFPIEPNRRQPAGDGLVSAIDGLVRSAAARHLLRVECKERSICCWALLRAAGIDATLVVGVNLFPLEGHCWCEARGHILSDYGDRCTMFTPVMRYA
jgi:hypothetical protein